MNDEHHRKLERMYLGAPINEYYKPTIRVTEGATEIRIQARPDFHHAAKGVHGSVYFKMLDDAAFFAASSLVTEVFLLTANFTTTFLRPVSEGELVAHGSVLSPGARQFLAEARLFDADGRLVGHGIGTFARSKVLLNADVGY